MSQTHHPDKRTKGQILRLLDHAMQQEEKLVEKIQSLESQLTECRKRAEDPRYEITESAIPASKVSFRLDYYRTEKKGPVKGIIEHLSSRETRSFGSDDGFDTIQQFVGKYLPVKARPKPKPLTPPSPFLEEKTPDVTALETSPLAVTVATPEAAPTFLEEKKPDTTALEARPVVTADLPEAAPTFLEEKTPDVTTSAVPPAALHRPRLSDFSENPPVSNGRLAARIRRSLSLPDAPESGETPAATASQPAAELVSATETATAPSPRRMPSPALGVTNERLATRIRRSLSLPAAPEPDEAQEAIATLPAAAKVATKTGGVFSVVAEGSEQHQAALQHEQPFQVEIPALQVPDFQEKMCQARLVAENLETGEQVRATDTCQPGLSALRVPRRPMQLPSGGYRLTAVLGSASDPRAVFYRESRLLVVK